MCIRDRKGRCGQQEPTDLPTTVTPSVGTAGQRHRGRHDRDAHPTDQPAVGPQPHQATDAYPCGQDERTGARQAEHGEGQILLVGLDDVDVAEGL